MDLFVVVLVLCYNWWKGWNGVIRKWNVGFLDFWDEVMLDEVRILSMVLEMSRSGRGGKVIVMNIFRI